jgi:hypothetical protein
MLLYVASIQNPKTLNEQRLKWFDSSARRATHIEIKWFKVKSFMNTNTDCNVNELLDLFW